MSKICLAEEDCSYIHSHHPAKGKKKVVRYATSTTKALEFAN